MTGNRYWLFNKNKECIIWVTENNIVFLKDIIKELKKYKIKKYEVRYRNFQHQTSTLSHLTLFRNIKQILPHIEQIKKEPGLQNSMKNPNNILTILTNLKHYKTKQEIQKAEQKLLTQNIAQDHAPTTTHPVKKIFIELTKNCNLNCQMCGHDAFLNTSKFNMEFSIFQKIAEELFPQAEFVDLRGFGESMLYPHWDKIFPIIKKYDCDFGLITNLAVKNDQRYKKMIEHDMWIQISWDGGTKETFEKIRRKAKWEIIMKNLELITKHKKEKKSKSCIEFIITVQGDNIKELVKIVEIGIKYNIDGFVFSPIISGNPHDTNCLWAHKTALKTYLPKAIKLAEKHKKKIQIISSFYGINNVEKYLKLEKLQHCNRPWSWIFIDCAGNVGPCNHLMDANFTLGNIKEEKSILHLRNNEGFQLLRALIDTKNRLNFCDFCYKRRFDN